MRHHLKRHSTSLMQHHPVQDTRTFWRLDLLNSYGFRIDIFFPSLEHATRMGHSGRYSRFLLHQVSPTFLSHSGFDLNMLPYCKIFSSATWHSHCSIFLATSDMPQHCALNTAPKSPATVLVLDMFVFCHFSLAESNPTICKVFYMTILQRKEAVADQLSLSPRNEIYTLTSE